MELVEACYVDSPRDQASEALLKELGVTINKVPAIDLLGRSLGAAEGKEDFVDEVYAFPFSSASSSARCLYRAGPSTAVTLEVADWAGCWVRVRLTGEAAAALSAGVVHRVFLDKALPPTGGQGMNGNGTGNGSGTARAWVVTAKDPEKPGGGKPPMRLSPKPATSTATAAAAVPFSRTISNASTSAAAVRSSTTWETQSTSGQSLEMQSISGQSMETQSTSGQSEVDSLERPGEGGEGGVVQLSSVRQLVADLCRQFYHLGWVTGSGGSISICHGNRVFMTPSGVQKERLQPQDMFVLDREGAVLSRPDEVAHGVRPKLSACAPLFQHAYRLRGAGAVLHSHGMYCVLATLLCERRGETEFRITHQEMIKGMIGHGYHDDLVVPVIENTAHEQDLADSMAEAIKRYPNANAVLVKRHGVYVWGPTWEKAKTQSECLHYLLECAVKMSELGFDPIGHPHSGCTGCGTAKPSQAGVAQVNGHHANGSHSTAGNDDTSMSSQSKKRKLDKDSAEQAPSPQVVLLDIEGTTTPITFVKDKLFPFARAKMESHLLENWSSPELQGLVTQLRKQAEADRGDGAPQVPAGGEGEGEGEGDGEGQVRSAVLAYLLWNMDKDRKLGPLKTLQGHIWRGGYSSGSLKGEVYPDVLPAMLSWKKAGRRVCIYSSGSREAQRLLFAHSTLGDLRGSISAYFDTTSGHKQQQASYKEIMLSLGVDSPAEVLFVTDVLGEAVAAREAGLQAVLSVRPGNAPLPEGHGFQVVTDFSTLLP